MEPVVAAALERWRGTLLTDDLYEQILAFEAADALEAAVSSAPTPPLMPAAPPPPAAAPPAPAAPPPPAPGGRVDLVAEGLAYVGAALALGFGAAVFGDLWENLGSLGRIVMMVVPTVIVGAAGITLGDEHRGSVRRLGTVLSALAVIGVGISTAVVLAELTEVKEVAVATLTGLAGLAVGIPTHRARASWPTTIVLGAAVLLTVFAGISWIELPSSSTMIGIILIGLGLAWASLGWSGHLRPRNAFEVTGLLTGGIGVQAMAFEGGITTTALCIGLLVSGAALAQALREERTPPAVLGGLGITVFAPQLVLHLFEDTMGAPLAIFVAGITLVAVSVLILRQRKPA
jgi:hypothetical protein